MRSCPPSLDGGKHKAAAETNRAGRKRHRGRHITPTWRSMAKPDGQPSGKPSRCASSVVLRLPREASCGTAIASRKRMRSAHAGRYGHRNWSRGGFSPGCDAYPTGVLRTGASVKGADLLIAKDHQPTLRKAHADLQQGRHPDQRRWQQAETWDKGHGRLEHRQLICRPDLNDWLGKPWEGVAQVFRLERTARLLKTGKLRQEVVSGISRLSRHEAPAARVLELLREHWAIESCLHLRRDSS